MIQDVMYRTISCNAPSCKNSVTFQQTEDRSGLADMVEQNPWFRTVRIVQANGNSYAYCSDSCELAGVAAGTHNPVERKSIVLPQGANALEAAKQEAQRTEQATKALKAGSGVTLGS